MDLAKDLEHWMTNLPQKLKSLPIIHLAIPGSHDSITYGITTKSRLAPDAERIIRDLRFLGPVLRVFMVEWSKTQLKNVLEQLNMGIRYLDFRVATKIGTDDFYFVHGLYSNGVGDVLEQIKGFLDTHPKEVIILDFQHFYAFQQSDHERLMHLVTSIFSHKLVPYSSHMTDLTLKYMQSWYQVVAIYRSDAARFGQPLLWPSACFPTPWANTVSISKLINFLDDRLRNRNSSVGFISQCVLTPSGWFVFKHLFSSLKSKCFVPLEKEKYRWLQKQKPGKGGVNVIISDFVGFKDANFARQVINLNLKLLDFSHVDDTSSSMTPVDNNV
ncbi:PI-PLC X domain-containing protein 3 [Asbolus verrucosus]|uniref:PI-PLC X domain-containing protein 3 n=1 Tax=Asbolus verrucosus TaxID=1661398 RepID=A0A482VQS1_ASBVE|nr:PI-PLC X domain-containing protein 3 [Asbolus verrucosus]